MTYLYTQKNLLHEPNSYMYAKYEGRILLDDYYQNRMHLLKKLYIPKPESFSALDMHVQAKVCELVLKGTSIEKSEFSNFLSPSFGVLSKLKPVETINPMAKDMSINSLLLLEKILHQLVINFDSQTLEKDLLVWLDQILQKFEVSKKLRTKYLPGFRKIEARHDHVGLYQYLSVILGLTYFKFSRLQYLSTLLKVNDLLLSQTKNFLNNDESFNSWGMGIILELHAVKNLD